ncbi:MAG TPA: DUF1697 domain-containing protein [Solirubrobacteraceae bacterium]|nr:DUF1697 domain-containing protein [Solirubrobacteraceae bacterium]
MLRGINLGKANRIAMPDLRNALAADGYGNVRTYVQSGNIVLDSDAPPDALAEQIGALVAERFGLEIAVVARTRHELAQVVERNPLADVATEPKRFQVSFLSAPLTPEVIDRIRALAADPERVQVIDREVYAWHPEGVARSKLWNGLASKGGLGPGITATARNWTTVTTLLEMANAE